MSLGQHTLDILIYRSDAIKLVKALVLWRQKSSRVTFCLTHLIAAPSFSWDFLSAVRDQGTLMNLMLFEIVGGNFLKWKTGNFIYTKKCDEVSLFTHGSRFVYCGCWGCLRSCEVYRDGERRKHATCLLFVCRMKVTTTNIGTFITSETKRSGLAAQSKTLQRASSACSRTGNFTELFFIVKCHICE